jgi:putative NADPH-quinone reductase
VSDLADEVPGIIDVERAHALAFTASVRWIGLPAILYGWLEGASFYGFASELGEADWQEGWRAERISPIRHRRR